MQWCVFVRKNNMPERHSPERSSKSSIDIFAALGNTALRLVETIVNIFDFSATGKAKNGKRK